VSSDDRRGTVHHATCVADRVKADDHDQRRVTVRPEIYAGLPINGRQPMPDVIQ
jgi:hypothetical protein